MCTFRTVLVWRNINKYFQCLKYIQRVTMEYRDNERQEVERFQRQPSMESEFICGCCSDLLVQPTTLTCGHSFCRLCLAQWFIQSRKRTCPFCQQAYLGCPKVNITIKYIYRLIYYYYFKTKQNTCIHITR